jgi:transcriptional regulator with XRE-family HTH domain
MNTQRPVSALRGRRAALGLSQTAVAMQIDRSAAWVSLLESGKYIPDAKEMAALAAVLRCDIADIFPELVAA